MALRVGPMGLCANVETSRGGLGKNMPTLRVVLWQGGEQVLQGSLLISASNQLITGADKGNPDV